MSLASRISDLLSGIGSDTKILRRQVSCNVGGLVSGAYYDNAFNGSATATLAASGNLLALVPFTSAVDMTIDRLGVVVTVVAATGGIVDLHIYEALTNGWPGAKLLSTGQLSTTTTGLKEATVSFTFEAGKTYWLGIRANSAVSVRGIPLSDCKQFGIGSTDGSSASKATGLVVSSTPPAAAPSSWGGVTVSQFTPILAPSFRMRAV